MKQAVTLSWISEDKTKVGSMNLFILLILEAWNVGLGSSADLKMIKF